jgi:peptide/nickel transport system substrate-binding protein
MHVSSDPSGAINRRELVKYGASGAAVLAGGQLLAACGGGGGSSESKGASGGPATSAGPPTGGTPVRGGRLVVGLPSGGASETIDVRTITTTTDLARGASLYDPLFRAAPGGYEPSLATSAEPNADATVWTLKLRDGVTFHNGKPFTADDVVYTIKSGWAAKESFYKTGTDGLVDVKNVRKRGPLEVEIPLLKPNSALPGFTSWGNAYIIPDGTTDFSKAIGTGAFKLESFKSGNSVFAANENYFRGAPFVDELVIDSSFTDEAARINAVLSKQLDIAPAVTWALAKANAKSGALILGNSPGPAMLNVTLRVNVAPFNDPRVVQALKLLTDRKEILNNVFSGYGTIGNDCCGNTFQFWASDIKPEYDPEKAKSLLKQAGQSDLSMPIITSPYRAGMVELAQTWSAQAAKIGLKLPVKQLPPSTFFTSGSPGYLTDARKLAVHPWDVVPAGLPAWYLTALNKTAVYNETGWGLVAGQDKLYDRAVAEPDPDKAAPLWLDVQEQQVKEGGWIIPVNYNYVDAYAPDVRGVETNPAGQCGNFDFHKAWKTST